MSIRILRASDGNGEAGRASIEADRDPDAPLIEVGATINWPAYFIGTTGTLITTSLGNYIDPSTAMIFFGHMDGDNIIIDSIAPGYTDNGNTEGQVVVIKQTYAWANAVADTLETSFDDDGTLKDSVVEDLATQVLTESRNASLGNITVGGKVTNPVQSISSGSAPTPTTITPDVTAYNIGECPALAVNATIAAPSGTPVNQQQYTLIIRDNGTARTLTWNATYKPIGITLPTATVANKTLYVTFVYSTTRSQWEVLSVGREA